VLRDHPKEAIYQKVPWYSAVVHGGRKYIRYLQPGVPEELYDLAADPEELKNLAADPAHAAKLAAMREMLVGELKRTNAPAELLSQPKGKP
jgi:arylsulfatase A-like enzyme